MKVEVLEFYLHVDNREDDFINGDVKLRIVDLGFDILGVYIQKKQKKVFVRMPGRKTICKKTGLEIWFPYFAMKDKEKQKELINEVIKVTTKFLLNWLEEKHNPKKESVTIQSVEKIINKTWDDVPPLKVRKRSDVRKF